MHPNLRLASNHLDSASPRPRVQEQAVSVRLAMRAAPLLARPAVAGRFQIEHLAFHLAGVPTYIVVAELGGNQVLTGSLPRPDYPPALREHAPQVWWSRAQLTLSYARNAHAPCGHTLHCAGAAARACCETAHAVLASRGEWVTNEKRLLDRAGLRHLDALVSSMTPEPTSLTAALDRIAVTLREAVGAA
jgi:hypothetical protein